MDTKLNKIFNFKNNNNNDFINNHNKIKSEENIKNNNFSFRNSSFINKKFSFSNKNKINEFIFNRNNNKNSNVNEKHLITKEDYLQYSYNLLKIGNYKKVYNILQKYLKNFYFFSKDKINEVIKLNEEISPDKIFNNLNIVKNKILKINFKDQIKTLYLRENKYENISDYMKILKNNEKYLNKMDKILISKLIK